MADYKLPVVVEFSEVIYSPQKKFKKTRTNSMRRLIKANENG